MTLSSSSYPAVMPSPISLVGRGYDPRIQDILRSAGQLRRHLEMSTDLGGDVGQRSMPWDGIGRILADPSHPLHHALKQFARQPSAMFPGGGAGPRWADPDFPESGEAEDFWPNSPGLTYPGLGDIESGACGPIGGAGNWGGRPCVEPQGFDAGDARTLMNTMRGEGRGRIDVRDLFRYATGGNPELRKAATDLLNDPAKLRSLMDEQGNISAARLSAQSMPDNIGRATREVMHDLQTRGERGIDRETAERRAQERGPLAGAYRMLCDNWSALDRNGERTQPGDNRTMEYKPERDPDGYLSMQELRRVGLADLRPMLR